MAALAFLGAGLLTAGIGAIVGATTRRAAARAVNTLSVDTSASASYVQSTIQNNSASVGQTNINNNQLIVDIAGTVNADTLSFFQSIDSSTQATAELNAQILSTMNVNLQSQLSAAVTQAANAQSGFFGSRAADADNQQTYRNAVSQAVSKYTKQENYTSVMQSVWNTNTMTVKISGNVNTKDFAIKQQIVSKVVAEALITAIINETNSVLTSSGTDLEIDQNASASSGTLNPQQWVGPLIASAVVSCISLIIILVLMFALKKGKQQ